MLKLAATDQQPKKPALKLAVYIKENHQRTESTQTEYSKSANLEISQSIIFKLIN